MGWRCYTHKSTLQCRLIFWTSQGRAVLINPSTRALVCHNAGATRSKKETGSHDVVEERRGDRGFCCSVLLLRGALSRILTATKHRPRHETVDRHAGKLLSAERE
jgi:hypothetical protein